MAAVAVTDGGGFARQIERFLGAAADQHLDRLLAIAVHHIHRTGGIDVAAQLIEFAQQGTPFVDALIAQTGGELEEAGVGGVESAAGRIDDQVAAELAAATR